MKNLLGLLFLVIGFVACQNPKTAETNRGTISYSKIIGETMGTTYSLTYSSDVNYQSAIDSLLVEINAQVNTYDSSSLISSFNTGEMLEMSSTSAPHFKMNYLAAKDIYEVTGGYFDPTVMPLVYYWGFGKRKIAVENADKNKVKELLSRTGFEKTWMERSKKDTTIYIYKKSLAATQLDFSAIAKGYGVDAVANLLKNNDVENYLVEIGGETVTKGVNALGDVWTLGINTPVENANPNSDFKALIQVSNRAIATSGNYRNYYEVDGKKYAHSINPKTGYPEMSNLLSVSVVMDNCMTADAYATAFMVMGLEKAWTLANERKEIEAYFIYDDNGEMKVKATDGFKELIIKEN
ncbi:MAG: FAD:protein FMN transferase [Saprospiraceae bacterium]